MSRDDDLYGILNVARNVSQDEIRRAYKKAALKWHPDKNPNNRELAEQKFKGVSRAYEILNDASARARYDRYGIGGVTGQHATTADHEAPHFTSRRTGGQYFTSSSSTPQFFQASFGGVPFRGASSSFTFRDPFDIFRDMFSGHTGFEQDEDDDDFNVFFGHPMMGGSQQQRSGAAPRTNNSNQTVFFGGSGMPSLFSGGGTMFSSSSSMSTSHGGGGVSQSKSVSTTIANGRKVTRTVTRVQRSDGTVTEDVDERIEEVPDSSSRQQRLRR